MTQPTHAELAGAIDALRQELATLRAELKPVSEAYRAATIGAAVLKWGVGVLGGIAAIAALFWPPKGM